MIREPLLKPWFHRVPLFEFQTLLHRLLIGFMTEPAPSLGYTIHATACQSTPTLFLNISLHFVKVSGSILYHPTLDRPEACTDWMLRPYDIPTQSGKVVS